MRGLVPVKQLIWKHLNLTLSFESNGRSNESFWRYINEEGGGELLNEKMGGPLVFVSDSRLTIQPISVKVVNQPRDEVSLWASLFIVALTLVVNTAAVIVIGAKEKTVVNRLIVFDSFANVLTALVQMLNLMALTMPISDDIVCIFAIAMLVTLTTWNRLVPVVLALYRYLLVSIQNIPKIQPASVLRSATPYLCKITAEKKLSGPR